MTIGVYIPLSNSVAWCRQVELLDGLRYVAVDNCSVDGSGEALSARGMDVRRNLVPLERVENWAACVDVFRSSTDRWLKWLFAGDALASDAADVVSEAAARYPDARLIVCEYDIAGDGPSRRWTTLGETRLIQPAESMALVALRGNWFGSPIGHSVRRDAIGSGAVFGSLPWVADARFCMEIAAHFPVAYCVRPVGTFNAAERAFFAARNMSTEASLEEGLLRLTAADYYLRLTGDTSGHAELRGTIERETLGSIIQRAGRRGITYRFAA